MTPTVPRSRGDAAALLVEVLAAACTAGEVVLIGSMAKPGASDACSDIDLQWTIPAGHAPDHLGSLRRTLRRVGAVESLRVDPEPRSGSLLAFVRFQGWPLWWRVDLEVHAAGIRSTDLEDSDPWSPHESACMGVIVTLKALARDRPGAAEDLFARALRRVGAPDVAADWPQRIGSLLDRIEAGSPPTADLVSRTRRLSRDVLGEPGS